MGRPDHIKRGSWSPVCGGSDTWTAEQKFNQIILNKGGKILSKYINSKTKIDVQCEFGHYWSTMPENIITNKWCPFCRQSKGELNVAETLSLLGINYIKEFHHPWLPNKSLLTASSQKFFTTLS